MYTNWRRAEKILFIFFCFRAPISGRSIIVAKLEETGLKKCRIYGSLRGQFEILWAEELVAGLDSTK
jgi:hypothetical protein